jgi:hypothetical protein
MRFWRSLAILIALPLMPASGQQLPPVYLNHVAISLDKATLDDLAASAFLKDEFKLRQQTTQVDGGTRSNTALYVSGRQT